MFDANLFALSEEKVSNIDTEFLKKRKKEYEKIVLNTIKDDSYHFYFSDNFDGTILISISREKDRNAYRKFGEIIYYGYLKYFEDEYCLYSVNNSIDENGIPIIEFMWNANNSNWLLQYFTSLINITSL